MTGMLFDDRNEAEAAERRAKAALFRRQWIDSTKPAPTVTCGCGHAAPLRFLYRCLYCGLFFCERCAEAHFGKTKEEYAREKR